MITRNKHIFTLSEAALAYALCAEQIFGIDGSLLNNNQAVLPIFVSHLFQSLEISIKHVGIASGLFTPQEARDSQRGKGHGIEAIAHLAVERLGGNHPSTSLVRILTLNADSNVRASVFIGKIISGGDLADTRKCYCSRRLGYGEVRDEEFSYLMPVREWIESVKYVASNLDSAIDLLKKWKASSIKAPTFSHWYYRYKQK